MKQPLGIWITDTHLSEHTIDVNFDIFAQLFNFCKNLGVKQIFHGGDIFTSRKGQPEIVLNTLKAIINKAKKEEIRIFAIPGNHDKTSYVSDSSFLDAFDEECFTVLKAGASMHYDNLIIHFLPYYDESLLYSKKLKEITDNLDDSQCNILLTHVGVDGVKNNGHVNVENDVKQDLFDRFYLVLVGHYHDHQLLGDRQHINYTGSAYQANFGEDGNKGCVVIFDDGSYEFVPLQFKSYITLDLLPQDIDSELIRMIAEKSTEAKIKIKITEELGDDKKGFVADLQAIGVKVEAEKESFNPIDRIGEAQVLLSDNDILENYNQWSVEKGIEDPEFGRSMLSQVL